MTSSEFIKGVADLQMLETKGIKWFTYEIQNIVNNKRSIHSSTVQGCLSYIERNRNNSATDDGLLLRKLVFEPTRQNKAKIKRDARSYRETISEGILADAEEFIEDYYRFGLENFRVTILQVYKTGILKLNYARDLILERKPEYQLTLIEDLRTRVTRQDPETGMPRYLDTEFGIKGREKSREYDRTRKNFLRKTDPEFYQKTREADRKYCRSEKGRKRRRDYVKNRLATDPEFRETSHKWHRKAAVKYRNNHPDRVKASAAKWKAKHPGYHTEWARKRYNTDPEFREKNRLKCKQYYEKHKKSMVI